MEDRLGATLPRLLRGFDGEVISYERHQEIHGPLADRGITLTAELTRAGLRGRGGGEFPLAEKLDAVRRARGAPVVVVNGCEGEPMSVKDRLLLESLPHLVLDGALCCARTIRAGDVLIAFDETAGPVGDAVEQALAERRDLGRGRKPAIVEVPGGYVSGQETAVVGFINGGPAIPSHIPPRVTERGVASRPTLVANPETLACAALIARHGAAWFRQLGTPEEPGSALVTLGGGVRHPGVFEIEYGSTLSSLIAAAGGLSEPARAFLFGGYAGTWVDAGWESSLRLSRAGLRHTGASPGAGIIVVLPQSGCPVVEVARVADWLADQSARQCGPCVYGLAAIADALAAAAQGTAARDVLRNIQRWSGQVAGRGACAHPDGATRFVASALTVFADELQDHCRHGRCDACDDPPILPTPSFRIATA